MLLEENAEEPRIGAQAGCRARKRQRLDNAAGGSLADGRRPGRDLEGRRGGDGELGALEN